jgi:hypothetical protein
VYVLCMSKLSVMVGDGRMSLFTSAPIIRHLLVEVLLKEIKVRKG